MKQFLKHVITAFSSVRLTPLVVLMLLCSDRELVWADMHRLGLQLKFKPPPNNLMGQISRFATCMTWCPEFRNIFYFRTGMLGQVLSIFCRPMSSLHFSLKGMKIGPGLFVAHGDGTFISADEIGENCSIFQQVTLGSIGEVTERPLRIGNNVTIFAGAKIVGRITIGDNVTIAANSLVITDVPSGATVVGVPAGIVFRKKHGGESLKTNI
jgi:serine O-acetyltransferase